MCSQGENLCLKLGNLRVWSRKSGVGTQESMLQQPSRNRWYLNSTGRANVLGCLSMEQKQHEFKCVSLGQADQSDYLALYWQNTCSTDWLLPFSSSPLAILLKGPSHTVNRAFWLHWLVHPIGAATLKWRGWRGLALKAIFPTFPSSLLSRSTHHHMLLCRRLSSCSIVKPVALTLFNDRPPWPDSINYTLAMSTHPCPPTQTLPCTPWWLETSSGPEAGDTVLARVPEVLCILVTTIVTQRIIFNVGNLCSV